MLNCHPEFSSGAGREEIISFMDKSGDELRMTQYIKFHQIEGVNYDEEI